MSPKGYVLSDHMLFGSVVATILVIVVTVQIALDTSYWTVFNHIMVWGSLIWYFILDYFYNFVIGGSYVGSLTMVCCRDSVSFLEVEKRSCLKTINTSGCKSICHRRLCRRRLFGSQR